jgi:long-chain acyl-CoA synthetase
VSPNLLALPLFHSGGQQALLFALHVGRSIVIMERFRVQTLQRLVAEHAIDNLFLMPTMLYDIVHAKDRVVLDSVRSVLIAGQALDPTLKQDFESGWKIPIFSNYGSTEIGHVAGWTSADLKAGRWTPGPVGRIYDGVEIDIRDDDGAPVAPGESGEIWVKNGNTKGYVDGATTATESLIVDGWVASGDVGYVQGDRLLYLVGRKRDMIKTGGFQVWPQEIEQVLRRHEAVADVAVVGVDDPRMGEIPKAFVVLAPGATGDRHTLSENLIAFCKDKLAHFKCIREIEYIDELPRSEAGKVQRGELVARARAAS